MLQPKRTKFRKMHKRPQPWSGYCRRDVSFGVLRPEVVGRGRLTARQIEAARRAMTRAKLPSRVRSDPRIPGQTDH